MRSSFRYIILPTVVVLLIFVATCLLSPSDVPDLPSILPWDKLVHFGMFFVLSAISLFDYYRLHAGKPSVIRWIFWGFVVPVCYGGAIELMQKYFFRSRSAELNDFIADILGSAVALVIALFWYKKNLNKEKKLSL